MTLKTLLVEDNDEFARVATETLKDHSFERARTYLEAIEKLKQNNYRFHIVDGFFPYGGHTPEDLIDELIQNRALQGVPMEKYIDIIMNQQDTGKLPLGAIFARDLKRNGFDNYLICSAADHHSYAYSGLKKLAQEWELNLHIADEAGKYERSKSTQEYWQSVKKNIEME